MSRYTRPRISNPSLLLVGPQKTAGDFLQVQPNDDVRESSSRVDVAGSSSLQLSLSEAAAAGSPHDGGEGGDGTGKRERGMVLYNVSPGTKLHVRFV